MPRIQHLDLLGEAKSGLFSNVKSADTYFLTTGTFEKKLNDYNRLNHEGVSSSFVKILNTESKILQSHRAGFARHPCTCVWSVLPPDRAILVQEISKKPENLKTTSPTKAPLTS